ncbi:MAG: hypothetical protein O3C28_13220 [Proteobacteria bacterium]|nr:hypothetical protein [Pseudomonadota bacterium]
MVLIRRLLELAEAAGKSHLRIITVQISRLGEVSAALEMVEAFAAAGRINPAVEKRPDWLSVFSQNPHY